MKSEGQSSSSALGQANVQSDVQTLLAPMIKSEESLLSSVRINFLHIYINSQNELILLFLKNELLCYYHDLVKVTYFSSM